MRLSLSWLKEFVSFSEAPLNLAEKLTMAGLEVDAIEFKGNEWDLIVVGHVTETEKHPNADKLTVAKVFDGKEYFQVVCGAPNCRPGLKTAFAKIGAVFTDEQGSFTIKKSKLRGIESHGMLCSGKELGLSEEAEGIIELPENVEVGSCLSAIYGDTILEISLTPNLNHANSVMGVARELAAITGKALEMPSVSFSCSEDPIEEFLRVKVIDQQGCPRYTSRLIKGVKVGPSPDWLRKRVEAAGFRSINNVVDVTNYVLAELGHPLHAFNYDRIAGQEIIVRKAEEGEIIHTLDGKERILEGSMLLICDQEKPIAIAGVMGGLNSEVDASASQIVLESAYFDPVSIRRTSKRLGLQTEASKRFERGSDPNAVLFSLDRAAQLIQLVAGGEIQSGVIDIKNREFSETNVTCRLSRVNEIIGLNLSRGEVETFFKNLSFSYQWDGQDSFTVRIPTYRVDIKSEIDLIEEVARLYGYDHIPRKANGALPSLIPPPPVYLFENEMRKRMLREGLQEFLTCDLIGPSILGGIGEELMSPEMQVHVLNPTSIEQSILRMSLLPGLMQVVQHNHARQNLTVAGFEVGRIHFRKQEQFFEQAVLGIVLTGSNIPSSWNKHSQVYDFYDIKGIVENLLQELGIQGVDYRNLGLSFFHPGRQASLFIDNQEIGSIGEIHPAIQRRLDVSQRVLFGEFNLHDMMQFVHPMKKVKPLPIYPASERDWTCTIKKSVPFSQIQQTIEALHSSLLKKVTLKDIYLSDKLGIDYHNVTLRFVYRDDAKTITNEAVEQEHHRLISYTTQVLNPFIKN